MPAHLSAAGMPRAALVAVAVTPSPYQQSRAPDAVRPGPSALPAFAIIVNVPNAADYAARPTGTPVAVAIAFHRLFKDGKLRADYETFHSTFKAATLDKSVYINFDLDRLGDFCVPPDDAFGSGFGFSISNYIQRVVSKYRAYTRPTPHELCLPDSGDFALSKRMADPLASQDVYRLQADRKAKVIDVYTLTSAWWERQSDGKHIVIRQVGEAPVAVGYKPHAYAFEVKALDPKPDAHGWVDPNAHFETVRSRLRWQMRILNGVLNSVGNFGRHDAMHEKYVARLDRLRIEVGGHTDRQEEDEQYNIFLSRGRAESFVNNLRQAMPEILTYPGAVGQIPDQVSKRLRPCPYGSKECGGVAGKRDPDCEKVTVRLVLD